ncbi:MAG: DUF1475 family protein [Opitutus sp.]
MIVFLRVVFTATLVSMLAVTSWAGFQCPLFAVPREVATHPWFIATLSDAYWGFLTFFVWVAFKETHWLSRVTWFVAILLLGNIAMAAYCLRELFRVAPASNSAAEILTVRHPNISRLGLALALTGVAVIAAAARN